MWSGLPGSTATQRASTPPNTTLGSPAASVKATTSFPVTAKMRARSDITRGLRELAGRARRARVSAKHMPVAISSLGVVAVADCETGERSLDGGHARYGRAGQDHDRQKEAEGEDSDRPPERRGVAVNCRGVGQAGGVEVIGRVAGDGAGEDRAQQGDADRAADLLGGVDHR